ncbi:fla cluster protein FlaF [Halorussus sp. AFM4]|uniref:fla cluster protein FlaF n=1 Tax=Halorussus sp. AFM4 TaxID=3421651 RepID=UPI003EBE4228
MGFSVSGATVVLFLGIVISFGIAHAAVNNGVEAVNDAYRDSADKELSQQNTAIEIADAHVANQGGDLQLNVTVNNTGTTTLSVEDTDILINGTYTSHDSMETLAVDGDTDTDLWLPGESLYFEDNLTSAPVRVKVVTESGVSASAEAEVV